MGNYGRDKSRQIYLTKEELLQLLLSSIEEFPCLNGQLCLSLADGKVISFVRHLTGDVVEYVQSEVNDPFSKIDKEEIIRRLDVAFEKIGSWGKLTLSFTVGMLINISWSSTYDLLPKVNKYKGRY